MRKRKIVAVWASIAIICFMLYVVLQLDRPESVDLSNDYTITTIDCNVVVISEELNVRSEPIRSFRYHQDAGTSYGQIRSVSPAKPLYMSVSEVYYPVDCRWDGDSKSGGDIKNGPFIGIAVADIKNNDRWKNYFPTSIERDPDGIVWISQKFGTLEYDTMSLE